LEHEALQSVADLLVKFTNANEVTLLEHTNLS
jgi:hypothetical protein